MGRTLLAFWFAFVALFGPQLCCCAPLGAAEPVAAETSSEPACPFCRAEAPPCCESPAAPADRPTHPDPCPCEKARATLADMAPAPAPALDWDDRLGLPDAPALADAGLPAVFAALAPTPPVDGPPLTGRARLALYSVLRC